MTGNPSTPRTPTGSVVICAYTMARWEQLCSAVESVLAQRPAVGELIVVIDHAPALLERAAAELAPRGAVVVPNAHAQGLSGARNTGTERATGDAVLYLDDDAEAEPGWVAGHLDHYRDPAVIGVGGHVSPLWEAGSPAWFPEEFGWVVGCSYTGLPVDAARIRNPIGANMSFRRSPVLDAGGFSEDLGRIGTLPVGCEETELAIRLAAAHPASVVLHEPRARVRHHVPAGRGTWRYFRTRCWSEGISKAKVSLLASGQAPLATERTYVRRTLPAGVRRGVADARRDRAGLARAGAIVAGLSLTGAGYLTGRVKERRG